MFSDVCEESKASPIEGSATLATARFRLATAAPRMSAARTNPARLGASDSATADTCHLRTVVRARVAAHHDFWVMLLPFIT